MSVKHKKLGITAKPGKLEVLYEREFDASRELVFRAFTEKELFGRWNGPDGYTTKFEKFEPQNGGSWRFTQTDQRGREYSFHGVYHEVSSPSLIIGTFEFEGLPEKGHVLLETTRFDELPGGRTKMTSQDVYQSVSDRDGMLQAGGNMEEGMEESYAKLDRILEELKKGA